MSTVIGYSNQIDSATLGGTWTNAANLKTRYLAQKATATAGAYLDIDLGANATIGLVALVSHTLNGGTVTITAGTSAGNASLYDSGPISVYQGQDFALTFGNVSARYWRVAVSGAGTIGRIFIGARFKPSVNIDWNPSLAIESRTSAVEALAGPEYFDNRPSRRVWQGKWSWLAEHEALIWLGVQKSIDVSGECYLIYDDEDTEHRGIRNFYGRLRTLGPIEYPYLDQYGAAIEISELI